MVRELLPIGARHQLVVLEHLQVDQPRLDPDGPERRRAPAQTSRRDRMVARQSAGVRRRLAPAHRVRAAAPDEPSAAATVEPGASGSPCRLAQRAATMDFAGGADGVTRSMTMAWSRAGATRCSSFDGDLLDAARRAQRLDLEAQMAVHLFLRRALPLQALDLVAVAQQLEVLPGREQQHDDEEPADGQRAPQLRAGAPRRPRGRSGCCGCPS